MDRDHVIFVVRVVVFTAVLIYIGGMFNYFPFMGNDMVLNCIGYCTTVICGVAAVCTCKIISEINKKSGSV